VRHPGYRLPCLISARTIGGNCEINLQQAGTVEHRHDSIDSLQFLPRNVQPEVEGLGELSTDLLAGSGCYVCVRFEEDL